MVEIRTIRLWEEDWYIPVVNGTPLPPMLPGYDGMLLAVATALWEVYKDYLMDKLGSEFGLEQSSERKLETARKYLAGPMEELVVALGDGKLKLDGIRPGYGVSAMIADGRPTRFAIVNPIGQLNPGSYQHAAETVEELHDVEEESSDFGP